jgi:hypothetical protein
VDACNALEGFVRLGAHVEETVDRECRQAACEKEDGLDERRGGAVAALLRPVLISSVHIARQECTEVSILLYIIVGHNVLEAKALAVFVPGNFCLLWLVGLKHAPSHVDCPGTPVALLALENHSDARVIQELLQPYYLHEIFNVTGHTISGICPSLPPRALGNRGV